MGLAPGKRGSESGRGLLAGDSTRASPHGFLGKSLRPAGRICGCPHLVSAPGVATGRDGWYREVQVTAPSKADTKPRAPKPPAWTPHMQAEVKHRTSLTYPTPTVC